jgi:hypothetical protein
MHVPVVRARNGESLHAEFAGLRSVTRSKG